MMWNDEPTCKDVKHGGTIVKWHAKSRRRRQGLLLRLLQVQASVVWCDMHQPHYSWWWCCMLSCWNNNLCSVSCWKVLSSSTVIIQILWIMTRGENAARQLVSRYFMVLPFCWFVAVSVPSFLILAKKGIVSFPRCFPYVIVLFWLPTL